MRSMIVLLVGLFGNTIDPCLAITWCEPGTQWKFHLLDFDVDRIRTYTYMNDVVVDGLNANWIQRVDTGSAYEIQNIYTYHQNNVIFKRISANNWDTLYYFGQVGDKWWPLITAGTGCTYPQGMIIITQVDSIYIGNTIIGRWRLAYTNAQGQPNNSYSFYMYDRFGTIDLRIDPTYCNNIVVDYWWTNFLSFTDPDITITTWPSTFVSLNIRTLLDGPFDPVLMRMSDDLRTANLIPTTQPYLTSGHMGMEMFGQSLLYIEGDNAIVDWILVELRTGSSPSILIQKRAFLLQRDGDVIDVNGNNLLRFYAVPAGSYHVSVRHRNHLGIMTATPHNLNGNITLLDLTLPSTLTYGSNARKIYPDVATMWSGNAISDHQVRYTGLGNDRDPILVRIGGIVPTLTLAGYYPEDLNMDGATRYTGTNNDRDVILQNIGGIIPTNTLYQQIP
ncbi:MAG: hypothetical protein M3R08_00320 [Bacteroidota bacterium]|nr:hypothetical protein [Bacteroidota bacterium]